MMKKRNLLLVLPLIASVVACAPSSNDDGNVDINKVLAYLLDNINVKADGKETVTYSGDYSYLNYENFVNVDRDYSNIKENDGSVTPAIRENTGHQFTTYFKATDGGTVKEVLNPDNTVTTSEYRINYNKVNFSEKFSNPFNFIDAGDIDEEFYLNKVKANYIVEMVTGYARYATTAQFKIENNRATELNFVFADRTNFVQTKDGEEIFITSKFELSIKIDYSVAPIKHLTPRSGADEKITAALVNKNNYTITFSSDLITSKSTVYVTEDAIYFQQAINNIGPSDGDIYYKKVSDGKYESYVYKSSVGKFNIESLSVEISAILPDFSKINPNILLKDSEGIYLVDSIAALNSLDNFVLPYYVIGDGYGRNGTIKVNENNEIVSFRGTFDAGTQFTINQTYFNYGSTSIPSWLDVANIK